LPPSLARQLLIWPAAPRFTCCVQCLTVYICYYAYLGYKCAWYVVYVVCLYCAIMYHLVCPAVRSVYLPSKSANVYCITCVVSLLHVGRRFAVQLT
jgi:hypothetical protein